MNQDMMMTKKDYQKAAEIVCKTRQTFNQNAMSDEFSASDVCDFITDAFVDFFRGDNPRFDEEKFRKACQK